VQDLNRFLRGWAGYFSYGASTVPFDQIVKHADRRLACCWHRHQRAWWYGRKLLNPRPDRFGLIRSTEAIEGEVRRWLHNPPRSDPYSGA
jgi:RNA-directed DNA polymerase